MPPRLVTFFAVCLLITPVLAQDSVEVSEGWNIIGSVTTGAIPEIISTIPPGIISTSFFGYSPGSGYESSDTLHRGMGYWVKVTTDGMIVFASSGSSACTDVTVDYEGVTYRTVSIGGQCWLDRNLNVGSMIGSGLTPTNNGVIEKYCYLDDSLNCGIYGGFYRYGEAVQYDTTPGTRGICPPEWHIPTYGDLETLSLTVGGNGNTLKALTQGTGAGIGTDSSGFSALLAGFLDDLGTWTYFGTGAHFLSSTYYIVGAAEGLAVWYPNSSISFPAPYNGNYGTSVRCLKD